jgi:hypothetical protein
MVAGHRLSHSHTPHRIAQSDVQYGRPMIGSPPATPAWASFQLPCELKYIRVLARNESENTTSINRVRQNKQIPYHQRPIPSNPISSLLPIEVGSAAVALGSPETWPITELSWKYSCFSFATLTWGRLPPSTPSLSSVEAFLSLLPPYTYQWQRDRDGAPSRTHVDKRLPRSSRRRRSNIIPAFCSP